MTMATAPVDEHAQAPLPPELRADLSRIACFAILLALTGVTLLAILVFVPYGSVFAEVVTTAMPLVLLPLGILIAVATCPLLLLMYGLQVLPGSKPRPAVEAAVTLRRIRVLLMVCIGVGFPVCLFGFVAAGDGRMSLWPLSVLAFGIACGCLLNLVRRALHQLAPPAPMRVVRGFGVVMESQAAAESPVAPMPAVAEPLPTPCADAEEALGTVLHVLAGLGVLVYGFRLWPLVLVCIDLAIGRFASLKAWGPVFDSWSAGLLLLVLGAGGCALYWVIWGITCIGTGARWYRMTLGFAWATNLLGGLRLLIAALMTLQGVPFWLRDVLMLSGAGWRTRGLSLWAAAADLAFPFILLVLITRMPVRALFLEHRQ